MRRRYIRTALLCSVPSWVIARDLGQRPVNPFAIAFSRIHGERQPAFMAA